MRALAEEGGLVYSHQPIYRNGMPGLALTLWRGMRKLKSYLRENSIAAVMPRSTNPAIMVNFLYTWLRKRGIQTVFDADGLPLQERVDFLGRDPRGVVLTWLKKQETKCLIHADKVLTRSEKAVDIHLNTLGSSDRFRFQVVSNGRNPTFFTPKKNQRLRIREQMGMGEQDILWIYSGSLGPEYELVDMLTLFKSFRERHPKSQFLILTRNLDFFHAGTPQGTPLGVSVKATSFTDIPDYLSAADVAISLRKPAKSLVGLAPVKLGEYLIMGLPVISTAGIGDTDEWLADKPFCYLYDKENYDSESLIQWVEAAKSISRTFIRDFGIQRFGLENSISEYLKALNNLHPDSPPKSPPEPLR